MTWGERRDGCDFGSAAGGFLIPIQLVKSVKRGSCSDGFPRAELLRGQSLIRGLRESGRAIAFAFVGEN